MATPHQLEVHQVLACSTAHLAFKEAALLSKKAPEETPFVYWKRPEGFLVYTAELPPDAERYPTMLGLARFAHSLGFEWVMLDRDGQTIENLPSYDWQGAEPH